MSARFEVVRTDAGYHARFRAANGRIVWITEVYTRRSSAYGALSALASEFGYRWSPPARDGRIGLGHWVHLDADWSIEVRDIDARPGATP